MSPSEHRAELTRLAMSLDSLIMKTPTSLLREKLTVANLALMRAIVEFEFNFPDHKVPK